MPHVDCFTAIRSLAALNKKSSWQQPPSAAAAMRVATGQIGGRSRGGGGVRQPQRLVTLICATAKQTARLQTSPKLRRLRRTKSRRRLLSFSDDMRRMQMKKQARAQRPIFDQLFYVRTRENNGNRRFASEKTLEKSKKIFGEQQKSQE